MARASTRKMARVNLHKALRDLTFAKTTHYRPAGDKPGHGFAQADDGKKIFFGDRFFQDIIYNRGFVLQAPCDISKLTRGVVLCGVREASTKKGGRASHVYSWWNCAGAQLKELSRVVFKGTTLTSQALRRRLRVGTDDTLWLIERVILHNDLELAEILVRKERGHEWEPKEGRYQDKAEILASVNFGNKSAFQVLEDLCREIDTELADFVATIDGRWPDKTGRAEQVAEPEHEDTVMPMDMNDLELFQKPEDKTSTPFVGFEMPAVGAAGAAGAAVAQQHTWGSAPAAGWQHQNPQQAEVYDPMSVNPPAGGTTPDYGPESPKTPQTPEYGATTPAHDGALSPVSPE